MFLFEHCTLTAGLVNLATSRKARLVEAIQALFGGRQLLVVAPMNLANTIIVTMERYLTTTLFLSLNSFSITLLEYPRDR